MFSSLGVTEALSQAEINDINIVLLLADSNQKVIRLNISVKEVARVHKFDSLEHLICEHEDCLKGEFTLAVVK